MIYDMIMHPDLFIAIKYCGIDDTVVMKYFHSLIEQATKCNPTYPIGYKMYKGRNIPRDEVDRNIWLVRGYFPGTGVFYKMTVVQLQDSSVSAARLTSSGKLTYPPKSGHYFVKLTMPVRVLKYKNKTTNLRFSSDRIEEWILEHSLLNGSTKIEHPSRQRCMSPKGMKLQGFKKRRPK